MGLREDFEEALAEDVNGFGEWVKPTDIIIDMARWELTVGFVTKDWRRVLNALEILNSRGNNEQQEQDKERGDRGLSDT